MKASQNECLNVLLSSDDNYAQHLGAAMYSLLEHNRDFERVTFYIVDNQISPDGRQKLSRVAEGFANAAIEWIPFGPWKEKLSLNMAWSISISSYARLFVAEMLPETVERILYLDCDMIVCGSLKELWQTELGGCVLGAVQDFVGDNVKGAVGVPPTEPYFNAGMLLIDLAAWRQRGIGGKCLEFIDARQGQVTHHDQGVLNGVLYADRKILPLRYNLMTIHYLFDRRRLEKYYGDHAQFYTEAEVEEAREDPGILHYTPSFTSRPWVKDCCHPLKKRYWQAVEKTLWKGARPVKNNAKWYVRLIDWRYRNLPL